MRRQGRATRSRRCAAANSFHRHFNSLWCCFTQVDESSRQSFRVGGVPPPLCSPRLPLRRLLRRETEIPITRRLLCLRPRMGLHWNFVRLPNTTPGTSLLATRLGKTSPFRLSYRAARCADVARGGPSSISGELSYGGVAGPR